MKLLCLGDATTGTRVTGATTASTLRTDITRATTRITATGEERIYETSLKTVSL